MEDKDYSYDDNGPLIDLENYSGKICPKCGAEYEDKFSFCIKDRSKLFLLWKCQNCGANFTEIQGYTQLSHCPKCGKEIPAVQKKILNERKSGKPAELKRMCSNCGKESEGTADYCGYCSGLIVSTKCTCGEIFRQRNDGSFDKYCPKCGKLNPIEQEKQKKVNIKKTQEKSIKKTALIFSLLLGVVLSGIGIFQIIPAIGNAVIRSTAGKDYKVGDIIEFGSYPYYENGAEKVIEWQILEKYNDGTALVISKYGIDGVPYHKPGGSITWETSTIREWLNNEFYNKALRNINENLIVESYLENKDNAKYGTKGGNNTYDKIFLLSIDESKKYFSSDNVRKAYPTSYANLKTKDKTACWWWLRSPGNYQNYAALVYHDGVVYPSGGSVANVGTAVRMALKINLKNL